jgi:hypothetical protein
MVVMSANNIAPKELEALYSKLELRTWPEGERVPGSISVEHQSVGNGNVASVTFAADAPLSDRWFALRIAADLPLNASLGSYAIWPHPEGGWMSRIRPGSETVVSALTRAATCDKTVLYVSFSERVSVREGVTPRDVLVVEAAGENQMCEAVNLPSPGSTIKELAVHCVGHFERPFKVTLADVFTTGGLVVPVSPRSVEMKEAEFVQPCGNDCQIVRP